MTELIQSYAAKNADSDLEPFAFARREPRPDDVTIDILYCGVCHSDLHSARNDWGYSFYPLVPGHEIIGRVTGVGSAVTKFGVGDMVGVGCFVDSCRTCGPCEANAESYCENYPTSTYGSVDRHDAQPTYGGYSEYIVVSDRFVLRLPPGLDPKTAAPLLCAGITTYSPLRHWKVGPGHRVAVVGLGGLGHMALKFARALGAEVTLFTRSADKEDEARRLGAHDVVVTTDSTRFADVAGRFNFILDTVPNSHDLNPYLSALTFDGVLILLGQLAPIDPPVHSTLLLTGRRSIAGSAVGGIAETQEMLDFCAANGIACDVEMIAIQDINVAYQRLLKGEVRYRFVIDNASLRNA